MKRERRFLNQDVALEGTSESPKITGYAAVFDKRSHDLGSFREVIHKNAFDKTLSKNLSVMGLLNHDSNLVLGRTTSGTMKVSVDDVGLKYEIDPPNTSYANDLLVSMRRKDIDGSSFAFYALEESWSVDKKTNENIRTILEAELLDCSVVTNGAYPDASSQCRSLFPDDKGVMPEEITTKIAELRNSQRKEKRGRNILAAVSSSKWAIHPDKLETICAFLTGWSEGHKVSKEEVQATMMGQDGVFDTESSNGVAVIPVYGVINQRMTLMAEICGGTSCDRLTSQLRAAVADPSVTAVVLDIDSPGGTVTGVPELCTEILKLREQKQIIAVSNGMAASAAYWIAAACSKVVVTPSGEVGSIGVYMTHQDISGALDKAGVKIQFIQAAKYKTDGNPYEALSDSARADMQEGVDAYYEMFVNGVAAGRGVSAETVKADFGQGRMLMAKDAVAIGMADSIATLDEVVSGFIGSPATIGSVAEIIADLSPVASLLAEAFPVAADPTMCECPCGPCVDGKHDECTEDGGCDFMADDDMDDDTLTSITPETVVTVESIPAVEAEVVSTSSRSAYLARIMSMFS